MSQAAQSALAVLLGAAVFVTLNEVQKRRWASGYFSVGQLLTGLDQDHLTPLRVLGKALIPFGAGAVAALGGPADGVALGAISALGGSVATSWPVFISMEGIPAELYGRQNELRLLHGMYAATCALLGFAGGLSIGVIGALGGATLLNFGYDLLLALAVEAVKIIVAVALGTLAVRWLADRSSRVAQVQRPPASKR